MANIIGVRFKDAGKVYDFSPGTHIIKKDDNVIVETSRGVEMGTVVVADKEIDETQLDSRQLKPIMRKATADDLEKAKKNRMREKEIFDVFTKKIEEHKLTMKPIDIDCTFDGSKILFYFTAESRVDFRELVKDLAGIYRTRIELRQIGVRDEAKMLGGLGICGRKFCCSSFLGEFQPVSIKMAKEQSLSLNPTKISGTCGRLMCCLKYEQDCYEELIKVTPKNGAYVETAEGKGVVVDAHLLTGMLKVKIDGNDEAPPISVKKTEIKVIRDGHSHQNRDNRANRISKDEAAALKKLEQN
jgi:cell fate regulator YaaT (PSP1 superfamily)